MKETLQKLVKSFGPVGYEDEVRVAIHEEIKGLADQISVNKLGSLIAVKQGSSQGKKIMLVAHMDEIGLIVKHIDARGFERVAQLGTVYPIYSIGGRVRFAEGQLGVI